MMRHSRNLQLMILILAIPAFVWMVPILWMLSMSLQPNELLMRTTTETALGLIPAQTTVENFIALFHFGHTIQWFINSVIISVSMTLGVLILSTTAGYALARLDFPGKNFIFALCLFGLTIPEQAIFIPLYTMFADLGWHNTYHGLVIPRLATPIGVFLMAQFFAGLPKEIEEAAYVDGVSRQRVFWSILLPLVRPAMVTLAVLTFLYAWNDYLWPLVSSQKTSNYTITVGLASIQSNFAQSEGLGRIMAAGIVASAPVLILFLMFQKYVVRAVALGGSKG
jgi:multiple sugar transport system permease protein